MRPWLRLFVISVIIFGAGYGLILYAGQIEEKNVISAEIASSAGIYLSLASVLTFLISLIMPLRRKIREREGRLRRFFGIGITKLVVIMLIIVIFSVIKGVPTYTNPLCRPGEYCKQIWGFVPISSIVTNFDSVEQNIFIDWGGFLVEFLIIYLVSLTLLYVYTRISE